jgi:hypothetical protein
MGKQYFPSPARERAGSSLGNSSVVVVTRTTCSVIHTFDLGGNEKEKTTVRIFPDETVLGNLVFMRSSVHLCQRKFFNKHLHFPIHDLHVFVHPLVSKSYTPCFCHVRTFPVSLGMVWVITVGHPMNQFHIHITTRNTTVDATSKKDIPANFEDFED